MVSDAISEHVNPIGAIERDVYQKSLRGKDGVGSPGVKTPASLGFTKCRTRQDVLALEMRMRTENNDKSKDQSKKESENTNLFDGLVSPVPFLIIFSC